MDGHKRDDLKDFEEYVVQALKDDLPVLEENLTHDRLPPRTQHEIRSGALYFLDLGAEEERRRIDARFAKVLEEMRDYKLLIQLLQGRIEALEARVAATG